MRLFFSLKLRNSRKRAAGQRPRLVLESLELRQMLAVSPWQNAAKALDVDKDDFISGTDALLIVNRINSGVDAKLPALAPGEVPDFYFDVDGDGYASGNDVVLIANRLNANTPPNTLTASLANDTGPDGVPNQDGITTDPTIAGNVMIDPALITLTARLNNSLQEVSIRGLVQPNGSFTLTQTFLQQLNAGPLSDGGYAVHLTGVNELGLVSTTTVSMLLDTAVAAPEQPDLPALSDTGIFDSDNLTNIAAPRITVAAEPGSTVTLFVDNQPIPAQVANPTAIFDLPALADGKHQVTARTVDSAGNVSGLSAPLELTILTAVPTVTMITVPFQDDLTPLIHVAVVETAPLKPGTPIYLDVDRNYDNIYFGADEVAAATSIVVNGKAAIQLNVPLADPGPLATAPIKLRVRVIDEAGNIGVDERSQTVDRRTSSALADYVQLDDGFFTFDEPEEILPRQTGYRAYFVRMTSQHWRTIPEVNLPEWNHWMTIVVPDGVTSRTATLNITGDDDLNGEPNYIPVPTLILALTTNSVVVELSQNPNKPLIFNDDGIERRENASIAYTFDQFLKHPDDPQWPVLVAMVKAAVKGMDAAQALVTDDEFETLPPDFGIDDFVVTGAANQGWATWLTAAVDDRVKAIIPALFDSLNQDEQSVHRYSAYGFFPEELIDYADLNLFDRTLTALGSQLGSIVDPYRYLNNGNFDIPKFMILAAGDEFFVPDASQAYFDDLPGTQNYLRYVPDTGHFLDFEGLFASAVFARAIVTNQHLPEFSWQMLEDGSIRVTTVDAPSAVKLWQSTNPDARDFRFAHTSVDWTSSDLSDQGGGVYVGVVAPPTNGATAFFVELTYPSGLVLPPTTSIPFKFTTQVSIQTKLPLFVWPYPIAAELTEPAPAAAHALSDRVLTPQAVGQSEAAAAVAFAVALENEMPGALTDEARNLTPDQRRVRTDKLQR